MWLLTCTADAEEFFQIEVGSESKVSETILIGDHSYLSDNIFNFDLWVGHNNLNLFTDSDQDFKILSAAPVEVFLSKKNVPFFYEEIKVGHERKR